MECVIDDTSKIELLRKQAVFSKLNDSEIEVLSSLLKESHIGPNQVIVKEGDSVDSVYLIASGTARVVHIKRAEDKSTSEEFLINMGAGQAIGLSDTGFYSLSGRRSATVISDTDMVVLRLSMAAFHGFALAYSNVSKIMREASEKMMGFSIPTGDDF